jgi:hypothetical protein
MTTFDNIKESDLKIHSLFEEAFPKIVDLLKTAPIPKAGNTMLFFIVKTNFIKEGVFELYQSENYYSIQILFRSLIEHFLRFEYVFFRLGLDKNDTVGEDYLKFCSLSENIDTGKAWKEVAKILEINPNLDPYDVLKEINEDMKKYSKQEIIDRAAQFRYKNIIKFINGHLNKHKEHRNDFILNIIPEYSNLSSFVHGGPGSDQMLMSMDTDEKRQKELLRIIRLTFLIAGSVKLFAFLTYFQYDKSFGKFYSEMGRIMKNIR